MSETASDPIADDVPPRGRVRRRQTAVEIRTRRRRVAIWALSFLLAALLVNAVVGENGYLATVEAAREEAALGAALTKVRLENQRLQSQGRRLALDPSAVEEAARRDLGMIRPGETLIVIKDATPSTPPSPAQ